jgi:hypothetical protein
VQQNGQDVGHPKHERAAGDWFCLPQNRALLGPGFIMNLERLHSV